MSGYTYPALRLTPANSPFFKNNASSPRSPTKLTRNEEAGLQLQKVIGTTTASVNGFDCLPATRSFAYVAGAAAVLATVDSDLNVTQRFFRAKTSANAFGRDAGGWHASPTPNEPRHRALGHVKEKSLGGSPLASSGRDWSDSPTGKSTTAKDRVKAATSVAVSPDGKWLAVGESGYKPRIVIFSLEGEQCDEPIAILSEHSFGVHALRFSPDSRFLASLGTVNDGFLFIWNVDKIGIPTLHASNKLTTLTSAIAWVGNLLVTVGLRYVKVWRPCDESVEPRNVEVSSVSFLTPRHRDSIRGSEFGNSILSPRHRTLSGRNSLLGDLLDCNFIAVVSLSDTQAIVCAEAGEVCLLSDIQGAQTLALVSALDFAISAACLDGRGTLHLHGITGQEETLISDEYLNSSRPSSRDRRRTMAVARASITSVAVIAACLVGDAVVKLSGEHGISIQYDSLSSAEDRSIALPAHNTSILGIAGVRPNSRNAARCFTYSADGVIRLWDALSTLVLQLKAYIPPGNGVGDAMNELKCVAASAAGEWLACGDKLGVLSILDQSTGTVLHHARAHSSEITAITTSSIGGIDLVVTAGRDRMVQVFTCIDGQLALRQTLDEHAGAVTGVLFDFNNKRLITHAADRSVVVREGIMRDPGQSETLVFAISRTVTLKATPTSMCLAGDDDLLIATVDRCISRYRLKNGQCSLSFKCSDPDGGEAAVLSKIAYASSLNGCPTIAGVSSTDKSVRLYTEYGSLIARDWGHTEGITDLALIDVDPDGQNNLARLVTVAADSTIFIWDTKPNGPPPPESFTINGLSAAFGEDAVSAPPLRKVISHTELSRFRRRASGEESEPSSPSIHLNASPQRLRRKTSRVSIVPAPRPEPESPRRKTVRHRSPSPPSPRNTMKQSTTMRRRSMANLRTKSSDNVTKDSSLPSIKASPSDTRATPSTFGSLSSSTTSLARSLRAYRKRLTASAQTDDPSPEVLRDLERELKLTVRMLAERTQVKSNNDGVMAKLLDEASDKLVGLLDERIKEHIETEVRKSSANSMAPATDSEDFAASMLHMTKGTGTKQAEEMEAVSGAMQHITLAERPAT
ncbi:hypothetical protein B0A48_02445 [Cryoendolithus antarcticus]|uniref:Uncharacterized protein n=1 Tax=Cryoendolithus antarcticus TaxID=1507870 RepID=A0A1V8TNZ8_9PEZI|nr:hypothetical protein B0A48_02445 [Cryoendolithus antarcticus]